MNILSAINLAIADAMAEDDKILVLGEDVADPEAGGVVGVTRGLSPRFGNHRVRSTPISEQAIIGAAIGAAMGQLSPVQPRKSQALDVSVCFETRQAASFEADTKVAWHHSPYIIHALTICDFDGIDL